MRNAHVLGFVVAAVGFGMLFGCGKEKPAAPAEDAYEGHVPEGAAAKEETAEIPADLKKQLEGMGYIKEEGKPSLEKHFTDFDGTFVMYEPGAGYTRYNEARAAERFSPCSTFKIPNTLIALDTGVADGPDFEIPWDEKAYPKEPWWDAKLAKMGIHWDKNHTLKNAFAQSVVWYYKEIAKKIGEERMNKYLAQFDYGNRDISSGLDSFWLTGSLEISADEQVEFLRRLVGTELGVSRETYAKAREIFVKEKDNDYTLSAKTGTCSKDGKPGVGWFVGYVERDSKTYVFAFNMEGDWDLITEKRVPTAKAILRDLKVLP